jgi:hypothetical protein
VTTRHLIAVILYIVGAICFVVGLLDVLNVYDINDGTGWGLIIGGLVIALVGHVVDRSPRV